MYLKLCQQKKFLRPGKGFTKHFRRTVKNEYENAVRNRFVWFPEERM